MASTALRLRAITGLPMFAPGDDLALLLGDAMQAAPPGEGDVLVIAQKIVSKAEGRIVEIASVSPSARAIALAEEVGKDPRVVEVILGEAVRVVRARPNLLIVEHKRGWVMANAGIDQSNVDHSGGGRLLLLPEDPDASAERLRVALSARFGVRLGVVINDSFGRAWRRGTAGIAIGAAGLPGLVDLRGAPDLFGRILEVSIIGYADEIAAAASLLMGQASEGQPAVLVSGLRWTAPDGTAADLVRPPAEDLFR